MLHKILLSQVKAAGFQTADQVHATIRSHIDEMKAWTKHMALVKKVKPSDTSPRPEWAKFANSKNPSEDYQEAVAKWQAKLDSIPRPYPAPELHPAMAAAVDVDGKVSYEVVDDSPTKDQVLLRKKMLLFETVNQAETEELMKISPPGRIRMWAIKTSDIQRADEARANAAAVKVNEMVKKVNIEKDEKKKAKMIDEVSSIQEGMSSPDFHAKNRSDEDRRFIAEHQSRALRADMVARWAAQQHNDIEDLTLDTIDGWTLQPYTA